LAALASSAAFFVDAEAAKAASKGRRAAEAGLKELEAAYTKADARLQRNIDTIALTPGPRGADGKDGCRMMKQSGSDIWSQDEKSSVIYGMPMAVAKAGLSDEILALDDIGPRLVEGVS